MKNRTRTILFELYSRDVATEGILIQGVNLYFHAIVGYQSKNTSSLMFII